MSLRNLANRCGDKYRALINWRAEKFCNDRAGISESIGMKSNQLEHPKGECMGEGRRDMCTVYNSLKISPKGSILEGS